MSNDIFSFENIRDLQTYFPMFSKHSNEFKNLSNKEKFEYAREKYRELPMVDLLTWMRVNEPGDEYYYKQAYWDQTMFIRDNINPLLNPDKYNYSDCMVVSTHMSKSIVLPVYYINSKEYGIRMILRNNFYDWKISVDSDYLLEGLEDFIGKEKDSIQPIYCEGFKEEWVYGMYKDDKTHFTVELSCNSYNFYTFIYKMREAATKRKRKEEK